MREARPALTIIAETPALFAPLLLAPLLGLLGIAAACLCESGVARRRWLALLAFALAGALATLWQVRVLASLAPLALTGGVYAVHAVWRALRTRLEPLPLQAMAVALGLPFCSLFWAVAAPAANWPATAAPDVSETCLANASYAPLAALGSATVLGPVDMGAHLLANTKANAIAAPFHRDTAGIRAAIEFFLAEPRQAREIALRAGARFIVTCPGLRELAIYAEKAPQGMAARLTAGNVPGWLHREALAETPIIVYRVD